MHDPGHATGLEPPSASGGSGAERPDGPRAPRAPARPAMAGPVVSVALVVLGTLILGGGLASLGPPSTSPSTPGPSSGGAAPTAAAGSRSPAPSAEGSASGASGDAAGIPSSPGSATSSDSPSSSPASDPVMVGAGDIGRCDSTLDDQTAALVARIPGIVFTLGDNAYDSGTAAEFRNCYGTSWGRFLDRTRFAVAGNHDDLTDGGAPFRAYFGPAAAPAGTTWFSADVGTWHVVVLDANCGGIVGGCGPDSPELRWLRADLAASTARCALALWHQPRFSSGEHGNDPSVAPFWDALYAAGADLVLNGHDHDYERFAPQDPAGRSDPVRGITEMVVGTGGATLRPMGPAVANSAIRQATAYGVVALQLRPTGWDFRFVSVDGTFGDAGSGTCH